MVCVSLVAQRYWEIEFRECCGCCVRIVVPCVVLCYAVCRVAMLIFLHCFRILGLLSFLVLNSVELDFNCSNSRAGLLDFWPRKGEGGGRCP